MQFYSSRQPSEATSYDELAPYLKLYIPLRLTRQLFLGYWAATVAYLISAIFVSVNLWWYAITGEIFQFFAQAITVAVIVTPLTLWMTQIQHRETIVSEKLALFRNGLMIILSLIFVAAGCAIGRGVYDHYTKPDGCPPHYLLNPTAKMC